MVFGSRISTKPLADHSSAAAEAVRPWTVADRVGAAERSGGRGVDESQERCEKQAGVLVGSTEGLTGSVSCRTSQEQVCRGETADLPGKEIGRLPRGFANDLGETVAEETNAERSAQFRRGCRLADLGKWPPNCKETEALLVPRKKGASQSALPEHLPLAGLPDRAVCTRASPHHGDSILKAPTVGRAKEMNERKLPRQDSNQENAKLILMCLQDKR